MRIAFVPPSEVEFLHLFNDATESVLLRKGGGLSDIVVYQPPSRFRQGGGLLSMIAGLARKVLPFLAKAAAPAVTEFGSSVMRDVTTGRRPLKKSLKKHGLRAVKKTGSRLLKGGRVTTPKRKALYKKDVFDYL